MRPTMIAPVASGALAAALGLTAAVLHLWPGVRSPDGLTDFVATNAVTAVSLGVAGAVVLHARPGHPVGRLMLVIAGCHGVTGAARELGLLALDRGQSGAAGWLLWAGSWPYLATLWFPLLLLLLPDGRLPGPRWRPVAVLAALAPVPIALSSALAPGPLLLAPLDGAEPVPTNPLGLVALPSFEFASGLLFLGCGAAALLAMARRWRQGGQQRQQLKWVALAGALIVVTIPVEIAVPWVGPLLGPVAVGAFAASVGIAVVRHQLLDVDVVVSRAVVFGVVTITLAAVYIATVTLTGTVLRSNDVASGLVAASLVAALLAPLREATQRGVDRLLYGLRSDPHAVAQRVSEAVDGSRSSEEVLPALATSVAAALRLPWARVQLDGEDPGPLPDGTVHLPLRHRGAPVGTLLLGPRLGGGPLTRPEERLLTPLTQQAAAVAHAVQLSRDLAASRDRLMDVREHERGRLRHDLHDGLGPLLAAITVQLDAARLLLGSDPRRAESVLAEAKNEVQQAVVDVRRLLDDLRPEALDAAGLSGAVAGLVDRLREAGLDVRLSASVPVELTPGVETAAYRIVAEALTNVVRHAGAGTVHVELRVEDDALDVVVRDDGLGLPAQPVPGLGLHSMRQRAQEQHGSLSVSSEPGAGTRVHARFPIGVPA